MKRLNRGEKAGFVKTAQTGKLQLRSFNDFAIMSRARLLVGIQQRVYRINLNVYIFHFNLLKRFS